MPITPGHAVSPSTALASDRAPAPPARRALPRAHHAGAVALARRPAARSAAHAGPPRLAGGGGSRGDRPGGAPLAGADAGPDAATSGRGAHLLSCPLAV